MGAPILLKLTEYQGSQNKYHRHSKGDYRIRGLINRFRLGTVANDSTQSSGALEYYASSAVKVGAAEYDSSNSNHRILELDTNLNSGAGWTGNSGYDGSSGQASKPATIACMWILRFI